MIRKKWSMALFFYVDFLSSNQFQVIIERILYELHKNATKKYPEPQRVILELMVPVEWHWWLPTLF